jgi:Helicase HerA, central domain
MQIQSSVGANPASVRSSGRSYATAPTLALQIIPPMQADQDLVALEAAMQSLVLDQKHPVALELAGTPQRRSFIVRATTVSALNHVEAVLRSQYSQMEVRALREEEDPFHLSENEAVSAIELASGGASYMPLRTWQKDQRGDQETMDPIMGLLSALTKLPEHTRVIAQLGLVPAANDWSRKDQRKSIENALDPEKRDLQHRQNIQRYQRDMSTHVLLSMGILVGFVTLAQPYIPLWMKQLIPALVRGKMPQLTSPQIVQLLIFAAILFLVAGGSFFLIYKIFQFFKRTPLYDMRKVAEKTSRMAYRTRLRLYAIGPKVLERWQIESGGNTAQFYENVVDAPQQAQAASNMWEQLRSEREQAEIREETLLRMVAAYRQFHMADGDYFVPRKLKTKEATSLLSSEPQKARYGWYKGIATSKHMISVDALAALWHLPQSSALPDMALMEHKRSRTLLIPPDLARQSAGLQPIGYSEHGGYRLPFGLIPQFFSVHTLISGKSGEGKSTIMEHIARDAMKQGGLVLIDPHGDLVDHVLQMVPPERADDVVLIDLSDKDASVGINILDVTLGRGRDKAISDLLKTLAHIWVSSWGPRMENAFEMALRTLFEANKVLVAQNPEEGPRQQYTLLDVLALLTNENFCHALLQQIEDDYLHRWWREYYEPLTLMQQRDIINPVITKVAKFESIIARRIIGQSVATLNFAQMITERKIILLKLAKGLIGADVAAIVGATMLGLIQITLEEQGNKSLQERARFPIILDEFQALAGIDYAALAELRKYGAAFILATQSLEYLQKLDPVLLPTVLANVKQLMIFHMSAQDAETLHKELGLEPEDILNLDLYTCYVKMPANSVRQPTFSLRVVMPPEGDPILAESIRTRCRVRYACSVQEIDQALRDAMIRSIRLAPAQRDRDKGRRNNFDNKQRGQNNNHNNQNNQNNHQNNNNHNNNNGANDPGGASRVVSAALAGNTPKLDDNDVILLGPATAATSPVAAPLPGSETSELVVGTAAELVTEQTAEEKHKRRTRGRRGGRRRNKGNGQGENAALATDDEGEYGEESFVEALSEDIGERLEDKSDPILRDELDLREIQALREQHARNGFEG